MILKHRIDKSCALRTWRIEGDEAGTMICGPEKYYTAIGADPILAPWVSIMSLTWISGKPSAGVKLTKWSPSKRDKPSSVQTQRKLWESRKILTYMIICQPSATVYVRTDKVPACAIIAAENAKRAPMTREAIAEAEIIYCKSKSRHRRCGPVRTCGPRYAYSCSCEPHWGFIHSGNEFCRGRSAHLKNTVTLRLRQSRFQGLRSRDRKLLGFLIHLHAEWG